MEDTIVIILAVLFAILFIFIYFKGIKEFLGGIVRDNTKCKDCIYYKYYMEHNKKDS